MNWELQDYLVAFNMVEGIGSRRLTALVAAFGSLEKAWHAPYKELIQVGGIGTKLAGQFVDQRGHIDPIQERKWAESHSARVVTILDKTDYPQCLRNLSNPPLVLYIQGKLPTQPGVAVIGSRKATRTGKTQAYNFVYRLASHGLPIISGLAQGIDTHAHLGALAANGSTVAVMATPINVVYPTENRRLAQEIAACGCIITEFSSRSRTTPGLFPLRNRVIAALAKAILVVEAGQKSGTLSTVDAGLELGRDVWAIPGDIAHPLRKGTHALIKQGAGLADSPEDILTAFPEISTGIADYLDHADQLVFKYYLQGYSAQRIVELTGLPIQQVQNTITLMEIEGVSEQGCNHRL
ncbi:MAG: DNA-processing protein DprA [Bacillota bacterium]|nr:DNA-processing protein DprA [Bacillota bacterium]